MKKKIVLLILTVMLLLTISHNENKAGEDDLPNPTFSPLIL
ncbi:MAG: hypothetical protein R3328_01525 [Planococcaceae bacterium]|nr:hypothetical protein [Planococcaceae bacterium]